MELAALLVVISQANADIRWQSVRGAELRGTFVDQELADGVHYAYRFRGGGTFTGFAMGKEIHGTWRLVGNEFCWMQRKFTAVEECFEVERRGNEIRFLRDGYEAFSGNLSPLKAQVPTGEPR
jgi:ribosomal protein S6E (S10)